MAFRFELSKYSSVFICYVTHEFKTGSITSEHKNPIHIPNIRHLSQPTTQTLKTGHNCYETKLDAKNGNFSACFSSRSWRQTDKLFPTTKGHSHISRSLSNPSRGLCKILACDWSLTWRHGVGFLPDASLLFPQKFRCDKKLEER